MDLANPYPNLEVSYQLMNNLSLVKKNKGSFLFHFISIPLARTPNVTTQMPVHNPIPAQHSVSLLHFLIFLFPLSETVELPALSSVVE